MTRKECVDRLEKIKQVLDSMFWKGQKEHPEKTEMLNTLTFAIGVLERVDVDKIKLLILKFCYIGDNCEWQLQEGVTGKEVAQAIVTYLQSEGK